MTAQKRAENVNTVPIVVSVLTNQDLIETRIDSTQQLEWATPGLVFGNTNGFAQPYIRGIGSDLITPGQDSPVGFYLDGVYLPFASSLLQQFGDTSRIEVLKGPLDHGWQRAIHPDDLTSFIEQSGIAKEIGGDCGASTENIVGFCSVPPSWRI